MFLDCDDVLNNEWIDIINKYLSDKFDILFFTSVEKYLYLDKTDLMENILRIKKISNYFSIPCSKVFKKEFLKNNNIIFNENIINGEDMLFNLRALLSTEKYAIINDNIYLYRINTYSSTKRFNKDFFESDKIFHKNLKELLTDKNIENYEYYCNYCLNNALYMILSKIGLITNRKQRKEYFNTFLSDPYYKYIHNYKVNWKNITKNDLFIIFIRYKFYNMLIDIINFKKRLKKTYIKSELIKV